MQQDYKFTEEDKAYILSKVKGIKYSQISYSLRMFWIEYRNKNESNGKANNT